MYDNPTISQLLQSHGAPRDGTEELLVMTDVTWKAKTDTNAFSLNGQKNRW